MAKAARKKKAENGTAANLGFEAELWKAADAMRGNLEPIAHRTHPSRRLDVAQQTQFL